MRLTRRGRLTVTLGLTTVVLVSACTTIALTRTSAGAGVALHAGPPCRLQVPGPDLRWDRPSAMSATTVAAVGARISATDDAIAVAIRRELSRRDGVVTDTATARATYRNVSDRARATGRELAVARAVLGRRDQALRCSVAVRPVADDLPAQQAGTSGLTPRADELRLAMRRVFGKQILGGFDPQGVTTGHMAGSAHYEGRAIDIFFRPITAASRQHGWLQANWAVAHAEQLHIATVIFDHRIWTAGSSLAGWRTYLPPGGPTDNPVLLHEDHVHVDVLAGTAAG